MNWLRAGHSLSLKLSASRTAHLPFAGLGRSIPPATARLPDASPCGRTTTLATVACLALSLAACQTPAVREITVTKEVPAPYAAPCPKPEDKPVRPKRVAEDHPVMPAPRDSSWEEALRAAQEQGRILAAKLLEWLTYGEAADGIMTACSGP